MTIPFQAREVVDWTGARQLRGSAQDSFDGVSIDSRQVAPGELFVAIRGPNHDAHRFLGQALERGAAGLLVEHGREKEISGPGTTVVLTADNTTCALGALAAGHRRSFRGPVVAVTGSNGKTTTKEMCASILSVGGPCLKNEGNLNNEFGLPLTLLRRSSGHRSAVVELGMNHRGEIARLAAIARPTVGLVTNVGSAHIEFLESRSEIAREKGDLLAALDSDCVAVINRDDPLVVEQIDRIKAHLLGFGQSSDADVRADDVRFLEEGAFAFDLIAPDATAAVRVAGLGRTTVINALAASAAALAAGASIDDVVSGLDRYRPIGGRMARVGLRRDVTLIDDSYNANPQSVRAALESLAELKGSSRGVAVLGDMGELGADAEQAHRDAGRLAAELGIEFLFALGERAEFVVAGAQDGGMDGSQVRIAQEPTQASDAIREILQPHDWVLVKGSREMQMERVIQALVAQEGV